MYFCYQWEGELVVLSGHFPNWRLDRYQGIFTNIQTQIPHGIGCYTCQHCLILRVGGGVINSWVCLKWFPYVLPSNSLLNNIISSYSLINNITSWLALRSNRDFSGKSKRQIKINLVFSLHTWKCENQ